MNALKNGLFTKVKKHFQKEKLRDYTLPCTSTLKFYLKIFCKFRSIVSKLIFSNEWELNTWFTFSYKKTTVLQVRSLKPMKAETGFWF